MITVITEYFQRGIHLCIWLNHQGTCEGPKSPRCPFHINTILFGQVCFIIFFTFWDRSDFPIFIYSVKKTKRSFYELIIQIILVVKRGVHKNKQSSINLHVFTYIQRYSFKLNVSTYTFFLTYDDIHINSNNCWNSYLLIPTIWGSCKKPKKM